MKWDVRNDFPDKWNINPVFRVERRVVHTDSANSAYLHQ